MYGNLQGESAIEPMKASGGGMRVAKLAAELNSPALPTAKSMKPKDLLRSIGKISQEDWQVKQIERKISENRLGRPVPSVAQHVPKWDREQVRIDQCTLIHEHGISQDC